MPTLDESVEVAISKEFATRLDRILTHTGITEATDLRIIGAALATLISWELLQSCEGAWAPTVEATLEPGPNGRPLLALEFSITCRLGAGLN